MMKRFEHIGFFVATFWFAFLQVPQVYAEEIAELPNLKLENSPGVTLLQQNLEAAQGGITRIALIGVLLVIFYGAVIMLKRGR